jgi:hypothetical protein
MKGYGSGSGSVPIITDPGGTKTNGSYGSETLLGGVWKSREKQCPESGAFFTSGSEMGEKSRYGSWMNIPDHISESRA